MKTEVVKREIKDSPVKREIKQEPAQVQLNRSIVSTALSSPSPKKVGNLAGLSEALVAEGGSPLKPDFEKKLLAAEYGRLGAEFGIKGAKFGYLGGRKRKVIEVDAVHSATFGQEQQEVEGS